MPEILPEIAAILLAAGESRRMGYPKPLLKIDGETFVAHLAATMLAAAPRLIVVVGAHASRVRAAIPRDERITIVENPDYLRGQLSSIKVALRALSSDCAAAIVHLADHPTVRPDTFSALVNDYRGRRMPIVVARHNGRKGHPVLFARGVFAELLDAPEDGGARTVVNADPGRIGYVDTDDPGVVLDLDTPADLTMAGLSPPPR